MLGLLEISFADLLDCNTVNFAKKDKKKKMIFIFVELLYYFIQVYAWGKIFLCVDIATIHGIT